MPLSSANHTFSPAFCLFLLSSSVVIRSPICRLCVPLPRGGGGGGGGGGHSVERRSAVVQLVTRSVCRCTCQRVRTLRRAFPEVHRSTCVGTRIWLPAFLSRSRTRASPATAVINPRKTGGRDRGVHVLQPCDDLFISLYRVFRKKENSLCSYSVRVTVKVHLAGHSA